MNSMDSEGLVIRILTYKGSRAALQRVLQHSGVPLNGLLPVYSCAISSVIVHADVICTICKTAVTTNRTLICDACQKSAETIARKAVERGEIDV